MNTGSNRVKKALASIVAAVISSLVAATVFAGPNQLDILGLVPGVTKRTQVLEADIDPLRFPSMIILEIGGYQIPCLPSFLNGDLDGKLARLECRTGQGTGKYEQYTVAANTKVHSTLTAGFTKKFGEPDSAKNVPVRTKMGVEYTQQFVTWKDKRGNKLQLVSMADTVNEGLITLESSEHLKQEAEKKAEAEARRKF